METFATASIEDASTCLSPSLILARKYMASCTESVCRRKMHQPVGVLTKGVRRRQANDEVDGVLFQSVCGFDLSFPSAFL